MAADQQQQEQQEDRRVSGDGREGSTGPQEQETARSTPSSTPARSKEVDAGDCCLRLVRDLVVVIVLLIVYLCFRLYTVDVDYSVMADLYNISVNTTQQFDLTGPSKLHHSGQKEEEEKKIGKDSSMRILYVVTSSSKTINHYRKGMDHFGSDRIREIMLPVMLDSIESMMEYGHTVDLYLIVSYVLDANEERYIQSRLPEGVGLEVWNDATPLDYDRPTDTKLKPVSRTLSRQHRLVVRDKLFEYDFFACFEDDMPILGEQIRHYLHLSEKIQQWKNSAPDKLPSVLYGMPYEDTFFGPLLQTQLMHIRPGFIRVERLLNETLYPTQEELDPVERNYNFSDYGYNGTHTFDPSVCCSSKRLAMPNRTVPSPEEMIMWETNVNGLALRQLPDGEWYGLLAGPRRQDPGHKVGKILTKAISNLKTRSQVDPKLLAQSAGWMMTRKQVLDLHVNVCKGAFLPPFDEPFQKDGLYMHNVEFWSGGIQMWCARDGCNIQRIVSLDPQLFSKHLLYHSANNKQKVISQDRRVRVHHFLGQMNTLRKAAIAKQAEYLQRYNKTNNGNSSGSIIDQVTGLFRLPEKKKA